MGCISAMSIFLEECEGTSVRTRVCQPFVVTFNHRQKKYPPSHIQADLGDGRVLDLFRRPCSDPLSQISPSTMTMSPEAFLRNHQAAIRSSCGWGRIPRLGTNQRQCQRLPIGAELKAGSMRSIFWRTARW